MKKVCKNPLCGKLFNPMDRKSRNTVTCCPACGDTWRSIRNGDLHINDDKKHTGVIRLHSGVEIRNDLMGQEISQPLIVYRGQ